MSDIDEDEIRILAMPVGVLLEIAANTWLLESLDEKFKLQNPGLTKSIVTVNEWLASVGMKRLNHD
jgi:hypothetical protein